MRGAAGSGPLVRIAESEAGPLYPTAEEAERQRAQDALAEVERLRAELDRLRKP